MNALLVLRRRLLPAALLVIVPLLLYLPALYYSLDTPFALVDDYNDFRRFSLRDAEGWKHTIPGWLRVYIFEVGNGGGEARYRPFWVVYNTISWNVFGMNPWLHHLMRWVLHFGAALMLAAAFRRIANQYTGKQRSNNPTAGPAAPDAWVALLPVGILAYIWLFHPNVPAARLGPQEVYTVFFLSLCSWMAALLLAGNSDGSGGGRRRLGMRRLQYALFVAGFLGLIASKEVNIALGLWLALSWYAALLIRRNISWPSILGGAPLVLLLLFFLYRVYGAAVYDPIEISNAGYDASLTAQQFLNQAAAILSGLFMMETSPVISAVFALLATALLVILAARVIGRRFDNRTLFMLFLLGQLVSMFVILSASFSVVLRYWYPLLPILAALLAFAAQFLLAFIHDRWRRLLPAAASAMIGFILFFVAVNYYNFLLQTTIQHGTRHADAQVIGEISQLLDAGEHIQVNQADFIFEPPFTLFIYFQDLAEAADGGRSQLQTAPPDDPEQPYYFLDHLRRDYPAPAHTDITSREDYPILAYARQVSGALQPWNGADAPYQWYDSAAEYPWLYRWVIYAWPVNARDWMAYLTSETGAPVIHSDWNVNINGNRLTYIKESCSPTDTEATFLLHIVPVDLARLPAERRRYGFDNLDFSFEPDGVSADGACAVRTRLPDYPIAVVRTGQYDADANIIWERAVSSAGNASGAPTYLQRLLANAGEPIALSDWNIHRNGLQLTYIKQSCAPADTEATFLLHIVPVDLADLPAQRRRYGYDNLDFSFEPGGAMGDGACAAVAWLPDYPIGNIRTGQYIPGAAAPLWAVAIGLPE